MKRDTLKKGIKYFTIFIFLSALWSCDDKNKRTRSKRALYQEYSIKQIGYKEYQYVWNSAKDSIKNWANNRLAYNSLYADNPWYLDSLLCFNRDNNRCVMAISYQLDQYANHDGMDYLFGAKIKDKWYFFFGGGHFTLPRDFYQKDVRVPLNIERFNEIALDNIFSGYLKKDKNGTWRVNDGFFTAHFEDVGWGDFERYQDTVVHGKRFNNKKEYFESIYLDVVKGNWIKK